MKLLKIHPILVLIFMTLATGLISGHALLAMAQQAPPPQESGEKAAAVESTKSPAPSDALKDATGTQATAAGQEQGKKRVPVIMEGKKTLPLRLLTRPYSNIYEKPEESAKPVVENVPTFSIFYAYATPKENPGWYEVGTDNRGTVKGWIKEKDVIEWKQYLTMSFTNPAERGQGLFFRDKETVEKLVADSSRSEKVQSIRQTIDEAVKDPQKDLPENFLVVAREPADFASLHKRPYLMPVLNFEQTDVDGKETRILEVATTVKGAAREDHGPSMKVTDADLGQPVTDSDTADIKEWKADVVFVIDTTVSMQPFIEGTRQVVKDAAKKIAESGIGGKISFGLVAYRDTIAMIPGIEYTSKIFCNLEDGTDINKFNQKVAEVQEAKVGSMGFDEDVWAGFKTALNDPAMKARPDASLFLIHIGDAGAHDPPDPMNTTGLNAQTVREMADAHQPFSAIVASLHLLSPEAKKSGNIQKAATQFRAVDTKNPETLAELYFGVEEGDPQLFRQKTDEVVTTFINSLSKAQKEGKLAKVKTLPGPPPTGGPKVEPAQPTVTNALEGAILAAQIEWLGIRKSEKGEVKVPTDIRAWVVDRDLEAPTKHPMDVRLLITKNNIDQLKKSLDKVLEAGTKAQVSGADFFSELQSTVATDVRGTKKLSLGKVGLLPEFIEGLPYKSEVLEMTNDDWSAMSPDNQAEFLNKVQAKIKLYENFYNDQSQWIELNKGDEPGDQVNFLDLNALP